jgi:hypothetical protein
MLALQLLCLMLVALQSSTALLITSPQLTARRSFLQSGFTAAAVIAAAPVAALAKEDCMKDCLRNCNKVAPGSPDYCKESCTDYCAETDRKDGLSGSVSDEGGEVSMDRGLIKLLNMLLLSFMIASAVIVNCCFYPVCC